MNDPEHADLANVINDIRDAEELASFVVGKTVERVGPAGGSGWLIVFTDGSTLMYDFHDYGDGEPPRPYFSAHETLRAWRARHPEEPGW